MSLELCHFSLKSSRQIVGNCLVSRPQETQASSCKPGPTTENLGFLKVFDRIFGHVNVYPQLCYRSM